MPKFMAAARWSSASKVVVNVSVAHNPVVAVAPLQESVEEREEETESVS